VKKPTLFFFHKYLGGNRLEYSHKIPKFWLWFAKHLWG
jgi:hypothetical protein